MEIKHGLVSADSHVVLDRDAFLRRMSRAKWGDRIPHIGEMKLSEAGGAIWDIAPPRDASGHPGAAPTVPSSERSVQRDAGQRNAGSDRLVHRWVVNGQPAGRIANCPAVMGDPERKTVPERWEEVPKIAYEPLERLKALDADGVDGEVLFFNDPGRGQFFQYGYDPEFELACVQAHNDALAEWQAASPRYAPLALVPYLSPIETIVAEIERAVEQGHRGVNLLAQPGSTVKGLDKHFNDPYWYPLYHVCQALDVPIHIHESGGLGGRLGVPRWRGYTPNQFHSFLTVPTAATVAQVIPSILLSGILDRFPGLRLVCAEAGLGWVNYVCEACDHEWEQRHLWTEGITTRPSEVVKRQIYTTFWYERESIKLRHLIGLDNIMWQSDYPHTASTYPKSWEFVEHSLEGVPDDERCKLLYENAIRVYKL